MSISHSLRALNRATLDRQGLLERGSGSPAAAIGRLAGLQAQHANMPYIALWSRLDGLTIRALEQALDDRTVVRGTVMRSTLHLVAAVDHGAFDVASAELRQATWRSIAQRAGLDMADLNARLLRFCVEPRTVAEMETHLESIGVRRTAFPLATGGGGLVHVPPSGHWKEHGRPRYIDARVWLPDVERPEPDVALRTAIERYLTAYGPASMGDIEKWIGQLRVGPVRAAIEALGDRLVRSTGPDGRDLLDLAGLSVPDEGVMAPPRFLSRWDSVIIGYDVRDRILPAEHRPAVAKKNGDFLPTFLVDGVVAGLWTVETKKGEAMLTLAPFGRVPAADRKALEDEAERLVRFVEGEAERHAVRWATPD